MVRSVSTVKPHVPLIKFRGSKLPSSGGHSVESQSSSKASASQRPIIEDYQLPQRYRRARLDEAEINAINSGGAY
ncbi:hypothetical protein M8J76_000652 [Diaphorina citri]|nr:hypothetical protein M8J76_000652 [Diaphorina citri]